MKTLGTITNEGFTCVIKEDDDGRVFFKADGDVDADGANGQNGAKPAYMVNNKGSEHLANGGMGMRNGKVVFIASWGRDIVIIGEDGQPKEFPGGVIASMTWWRDRSVPASEPQSYVDSETVPYIVVPSLIIQGVKGVVRGCKGRITNTLNGKGVDCVTADKGPRTKIGELSIAACREIGIDPNPRSGGTERAILDYELWPGEPAVVNGRTYDLQPS